MGLGVTSHEEENDESQAGRGEKQYRVLFILRTYCKGVFVTASNRTLIDLQIQLKMLIRSNSMWQSSHLELN